MKGDFSRLPYASEIETKHYTAVLDQQGRVKTDYDKAEEVAIESHLRQQALRDIVGRSGAPADNPGFQLSRSPEGDLVIGAGHYYVDGVLCANDRAVSFTEQPDLPGQELPEAAGRYLAYLRVFERHVTAIEDPDIREVALGGPDTTTRKRTVCGVRLFEVADDAHCLSAFPEWEQAVAPGDGQLSARARRSEDSDDPCLVPPDAGFTGLKNQLFRIEVRQGGAPGVATFLWDEDNASFALPIEDVLEDQPTRVRLRNLGRFELPKAGDLLEITDDVRELNGEPGQLLHVETADPATGIITLDGQVDPLSQEHHPKVRRWSGGEELTVSVGAFIPLDRGVEVSFAGTQFRAGDYWVIAARTATGDVIWPMQGGEPLPQAPQGIKYHHVPLALLDFNEDAFDIVTDCRRIFQPLSQTVLRIRRVETAADNQVLPHNGEIRATGLRQGVNVVFSAPLSEDIFGGPALGQLINPAVALQMYLPEPPFIDERQLWGLNRNEFFGFRPVVLAGTVSLQAGRGERLQWQPSESAGRWLQEELFSRLTLPGETRPIVERLLCVLRVRGDFIWADGADGTRVFLDGETTANPVTRAGLDLPGGNGTPGGSFMLSFWLVSAGVQLPLVLAVGVSLNVVSGTVSRGGEPVEAATVRLRRTSPPAAGSEQTTQSDAAGQFSFTALPGEYTVIAESLGDTAEQAVEVGPVIVAPGGGAPVPGGPGDLSVVEISGIGPVFRELLAAHGISRVEEFASLPPDRIAEILPVSVERARTLIANARRLIEE
jgi:predicted flap endonuclease-1-like 5' DNA nuclease